MCAICTLISGPTFEDPCLIPQLNGYKSCHVLDVFNGVSHLEISSVHMYIIRCKTMDNNMRYGM